MTWPCELNIECLLHFIDKQNKPQIDAVPCPQVSGLGLHEGASGPKSCLVILFVICCIMFLSHLCWWFLSSIKVGTKSVSIPVSSPYPNVVLHIENILDKYFPNDSLFSGLRQTYG